jgi:HK97 family phage prohead protease
MKETRILLSDKNRPSVRVETVEKNIYLTGYAAVFNQRSRLIWERGEIFTEVILPGAFDQVLQDPGLDVPLVLDHDHFYSLGRTVSGSLTLEADEIGLKFRLLVPDTNLGRDTVEMVRRGDYTDCSFMFTVEADGETWKRDPETGELIHEVKNVSGLYDVTICTLRGAYAETLVDVDKASRIAKEIPDPKGTRENVPAGDPPAGDPPAGEPNEKSEEGEEDPEKSEIENELDAMLIDVHRAKSGI